MKDACFARLYDDDDDDRPTRLKDFEILLRCVTDEIHFNEPDDGSEKMSYNLFTPLRRRCCITVFIIFAQRVQGQTTYDIKIMIQRGVCTTLEEKKIKNKHITIIILIENLLR